MLALALTVSLVTTGCSTGSEAVDSFGEYWYGLFNDTFGGDMFGTGDSRAIGGMEDETDPQSNKNDVVLANYDVTDVKQAPAEEKAQYDFSGPENAGISEKADAAKPIYSKEEASNETAEKVVNGSTVIFAPGHSAGGIISTFEINHKAGYYQFAVDIASALCNSENKTSLECEGDIIFPDKKAASYSKKLSGKNKYAAVPGDLYKILVNKKATFKSKDKKQVAKLMDALVDYGVFRKKGEDYVAVCRKNYQKKVGKAAAQYDKIYKKLDKLIDKLNNALQISGTCTIVADDGWDLSGLPSFLSSKCFVGNSTSMTQYFKLGSTGGAQYKKTTEYAINWTTAKALGNALKKKGYSVIYTKSKADDKVLTDGKYATNRNTALLCNDSSAFAVIDLHWDGGRSNKGAQLFHTSNTYEPSNGIAESSKNFCDAVKGNKESLFVDSSPVKEENGYTFLNWCETPVILMECGTLTKDDYGRFATKGKGAVKVKSKEFKNWVSKMADALDAGLKAVKKENKTKTKTD